MMVNALTMPTDDIKISWVGFLLEDGARKWYTSRKAEAEASGFSDTWPAFEEAFKERFTDRLADRSDLEKMENLKYKDSIYTYFAQLDELNTQVGAHGVQYRTLILRAMNKHIIKGVMARHGAIPKNDRDLVQALKDAGDAYEEWLRIEKWDQAKHSKAPEASGKTVKGTTGSNATTGKDAVSGKGDSKPKAVKAKEGSKGAAAVTDTKKPKIWEGSTWKDGVPQEEIEEHRGYPAEEGKCHRCGMKGHKGPWCFAKKTVRGTPLPAAQKSTVAATKRKRDDTPSEEIEEVPTDPKRIKVTATVDPNAGKQQHMEWEYISDVSLD